MDDGRDFITLLFARNLAEAEFYKSLLEEHEIPVLIEDENTESMGLPDLARGVPVLVQDDQIEIAQDIIEQRTSLDDELDDELDDDDDEEEEDEFEDMEVLDLEEVEVVDVDDDDEDEVDDDEVLF
jgi:DNA-directed RNA polymerase subunit delta